MDSRHFLITVLSGVIGTIAMTLFMYLYSYVSSNFTKVIHILGNMLIGERNYYSPNKKAFIVGTIAHFGVGVLFSFGYFLLWNWGVFKINLQDSILIGAVSGVIAIVVWKAYLSVHSNPPQLSQFHYFLALFLAHIVFGLVSVNLFHQIIENPELWYQLQEDAKLTQ
ncbi:hypothetical protein [Algoriphagus aquimarinus]|uniref:DUF2938 domain-containing protein n=1 Tax=Algoriphagus aquimarinus TaxID=237018 RepID=A0A1I0XMN7_9BACT|nr:hypothetical protein [Algoriphagus aquimarinus]SFB02261.1 hypothetical protein SAMN04489723_103282 [Algoriphagus aquimarinus]